jgi:hypothetical protein
MKMTTVVSIASATLVALLLAGCSALRPAPAPTEPAPTAQVTPATGVQYHFVTSHLQIPTTRAETQTFALNVDGDPKNQPDNMFGGLLTLLTSAAPGLKLQSNLDLAVNAGQLVSLHAVKADYPLNDSSVSWSIFQGQKAQSPPSFDGSDKFAVDPASPTIPPIIGALTSGHFSGGPGTARQQMYLFGQPVEVILIGVRLEADVSATGCANGKLGGGVSVDEFRGKLLPAIAEGLNQTIKADKTAADAILPVLDSNHDGTITVLELENNPVFMLAITPDLDLLDAAGKFNPGQDGVKDAYSVGLGFTCAPATFSAPGD